MGFQTGPKLVPVPKPSDSSTGSDSAHESAMDSKLENALESDPEFFKDPLIGKTIEKCTIQKFIGEGRTSMVYRAHYAPLGRAVAIKILKHEIAKIPEVLVNFEREGRAVAKLDHPNILRIYDVGRDDEGRNYMVLELLKGLDLLAFVDKTKTGKLSVTEALDTVAQAAAGLEVAHRRNIVHRDIKPQNLVRDKQGGIKIVDFGLAVKATEADAVGRIGTPHYMSPEQVRGEEAGPPSDIYALGISLFHLITGKPPYKGRKSTKAILQAHVEGKPLRPDQPGTGVPKAVGEMVRHAASPW